ncbi:flagellar export protein FliJ [Pseudomonas lopnurensis]|uniref:flagellar export protein FliJ n=1 Tax=Pseudomonas lopnurensis TaxID=1477517 RepID=UPI0028AD934E|nr:flagellar export protein FliJ [Pseudomonas lopnurensis]
MPASRAARLTPVIEMAERAEREAARLLAQGQMQLAQAEAKLGELEQYFTDYQQQWLQQGSQGVSGQWLMNYQRFLSQLESAIGQQQRSVNWHRDNLLKLREQWRQRHARLGGLSKLVEGYLREARIAADKREQKLLDEFAQRLAGRPRER